MDYLRAHAIPNFTLYVTPNNSAPVSPAAILGNNIQPLSAGNPFSNDMRAWYSVMILNNRSDTGFVGGTDDDHSVVIYVTGYGPMGAVATLEWEVVSDPSGAPDKPFTLVGWRQIL
jgi:ABC-type antimicrobial peptide transport system permease subunit